MWVQPSKEELDAGSAEWSEEFRRGRGSSPRAAAKPRAISRDPSKVSARARAKPVGSFWNKKAPKRPTPWPRVVPGGALPWLAHPAEFPSPCACCGQGAPCGCAARAVEEPPVDEPPIEALPESAAGSEEDNETLVTRGGPPAALTWTALVIDRASPAKLPAGGGVYLVYQAGKPIYVGQAASFRARWAARLQGLRQLGLMKAELTPPLKLHVSFGTLQPNTEPVRHLVEHALVRALTKSGVAAPGQLRNLQSTRPFKLLGRVVIRNLLPSDLAAPVAARLPELSGNVLTLDQKTTPVFEVFPEVAFP